MKIKAVSMFLAAAMCLCALACIGPAPVKAAEILEIIRMGGADRYETSALIAGEGWKSSNAVFIASGTNFADALAGVPLAYAYDAPILLVGGSVLSESVENKIENLKAETVYILGGTASVSSAVENLLKEKGMVIKRLAGDTRFETSVEIANLLAEKKGTPKTAFAVSAESYPDALSIGSVAAINGVPILYVAGSGKINANVGKFISDSKVSALTVIGGEAAVANAVFEDAASAGVATVERVSGANRYLTSVGVYKKYASVLTGDGIAFATGKDFPDALAGGVFAAKKCVPVILTNNTSVESDAVAQIAADKTTLAYVFGGTSTVSDAIVRAYFPTSDVSSGSDVSGSDVSGSDVSGSDVSGSDVSGSDVSGSDVSGSDVSGSDVSGSDVSGSDA